MKNDDKHDCNLINKKKANDEIIIIQLFVKPFSVNCKYSTYFQNRNTT